MLMMRYWYAIAHSKLRPCFLSLPRLPTTSRASRFLLRYHLCSHPFQRKCSYFHASQLPLANTFLLLLSLYHVQAFTQYSRCAIVLARIPWFVLSFCTCYDTQPHSYHYFYCPVHSRPLYVLGYRCIRFLWPICTAITCQDNNL